jgi:hypothetical protein
MTAQVEAAAAAKESAAAVRSRLSKYIAAFIWIWTFGLMNRIAGAITNELGQDPIFALFWLHTLFVPMQGFFNFFM